MAKMMVECENPNDLDALYEAVEDQAGKCNITYFKQAQAMIESGHAKNINSAAAKMAEQEGVSKEAVRKRIERGAEKVGQPVQQNSNAAMPSIPTTTESEQKPSNRGGAREGAGRPAKQRGSFDDWRKLCELERVVTAAIAEIGTLTVDAQHRIPARSKCESLAEKFKKLAQKLVG